MPAVYAFRSLLAAASLLLLAPRPAGAEVLHLKNGKRVEARVLSRTDESITVDWHGAPVTYWLDEIARIEGTPAQELLQQSSIPHALAQNETLVRAWLSHYDPKPEDTAGRLAWASMKHAMLEAFGADTLLARVVEHMTAQWREAEAAETRAWLRSPTGQRIVALEVAGLEKRARPGERAPLIPVREALLVELTRALQAAGPPPALQAFLEKAPEPAPGPAQLALIYETATDEELRQYLAFLQSPAGRWFQGVTTEGLGLAGEEARAATTRHLERFSR